ncbi:MAG: hypothetical protein AAFY71_28440 [Bacteroidota bacterium]
MAAPQDPLIEHTLQYALAIRDFGKHLPMTVANVEDLKELIRTSGTVGQTYIKATQAPNKYDYKLGLKACYGQLNSTIYWLKLVDVQGQGELEKRREQLIQATSELMNLLKKIIESR